MPNEYTMTRISPDSDMHTIEDANGEVIDVAPDVDTAKARIEQLNRDLINTIVDLSEYGSSEH